MARFRVILKNSLPEFEIEAASYQIDKQSLSETGGMVLFVKEGPRTANKDHVAAAVWMNELAAIVRLDDAGSERPERPQAKIRGALSQG